MALKNVTIDVMNGVGGGYIPAITASYERLTAVSVIDVGHFPKAGVIEVYEDDNATCAKSK